MQYWQRRINECPFKCLISLNKIQPSLAFCMESLGKASHISRDDLLLDDEAIDETEATGHGKE